MSDTFLSAFSTPDDQMEIITPAEVWRNFNAMCGRVKPRPHFLWHHDNGTTFVHQLTDAEVSYLISHDFKLTDLRGLVDFNWLEMRLPMPFERIEVHMDTKPNSFVANVYEHSESVSAIWTGAVHNVSNIKERKGKDLVQLCKDVIEEVIPWYQKWADICTAALSEPAKENQ